jgi:hypothetical protein
MPQMQIIDMGNNNSGGGFLDNILKYSQLMTQMSASKAEIEHSKWSESFQEKQSALQQSQQAQENQYKQDALKMSQEDLGLRKDEFGWRKTTTAEDQIFKQQDLGLRQSAYQEGVRSSLVNENLNQSKFIAEQGRWNDEQPMRDANVQALRDAHEKADLGLELARTYGREEAGINMAGLRLKQQEDESKFAQKQADNSLAFVATLGKASIEDLHNLNKIAQSNPDAIPNESYRKLLADIDANPDYLKDPGGAIRAFAVDPTDKAALAGIKVHALTEAQNLLDKNLAVGNLAKDSKGLPLADQFGFYKNQVFSAMSDLVDTVVDGKKAKDIKSSLALTGGILNSSTTAESTPLPESSKLGDIPVNASLKKPDSKQKTIFEFFTGGNSLLLRNLDAMEANPEIQYSTKDPAIKASIDQKQNAVNSIGKYHVGSDAWNQIVSNVTTNKSLYETNLTAGALGDIYQIIQTSPTYGGDIGKANDLVERYLNNFEQSFGISLNSSERVLIKKWRDDKIKSQKIYNETQQNLNYNW